MTPGMTILEFTSGTEWEAWLEVNHSVSPDAWLRIAKKRSQVAGISIGEALDGALCFGWIDGQRKALDENSFLQRYSPRSPTSSWSKINVDKFEALSAAGRVRPPGLAAVEAAKADGRWDAAYESQATATVPDDLAAALADNPRAAVAFDRLDRSSRYLIILDLFKAPTGPRRRSALARHIAVLDDGSDSSS